MFLFCLIILAFIFSWRLARGLRQYALATSMVDVPNHRSSHDIPTPRGGGLSFVISFLITVPFLCSVGFVSIPMSVVLMSAGLFIAILGFLDDRGNVPVRWRLLGQFVASIFVLIALGGMPSIKIIAWTFPAGWILDFLIVLYLVWLTNLYNFMDGIDGIAAIEAISVCVGGATLYWMVGVSAYTIMPLMLAVAVAGFLYWNFPPARIFMGDVGSGFLGFILGVMSIQAAFIKPQLFWSWLILLGIFVVDATITLLRRLLQGDKIIEAHCTHAYQHAARYFGNHRSVTLSVLFFNIFWLLPIALAVAFNVVSGFYGLLIGYLPLIIIVFKFDAGISVSKTSLAEGN